jgi:hypothetical protein
MPTPTTDPSTATAPTRRRRGRRGGVTAVVAALAALVPAACTGGGGTVATTTTAPTTTTIPEATTTTEPPLETGRQLFVYNPEAGQCFDVRVVESGATERVRSDATARGTGQVVLLLDCALPHQYEVAGTVAVPVPPAEWPGEEALADAARRVCPPVFASYVGQSYERSSLELGWVLPEADEWRPGRQTVACVVFDPVAGKLIGPVQGTGR